MNFRYIVAALMMLGCLAVPAQAQQDEREFIDGRWVKTADPNANTPAGELARIRLCVANQEGSQALELAQSFLAKHPENPGREEVMYLAGQAEMIRGMYYQAFERFKQQWDEYPSGQFSEKALQRELEIANAFLAGKKRVFAKIFYLPARSEGQEILTRIAEQAPGSTIAEIALLRIAQDHVAHGEYVEAAQSYDRCYELFPKSAKAKDAMLQAARATHASFKGMQFDPTPLIEAEQRYKQFQNDYPQTAVRVAVPEAIKQIERQKASEDFASAQLYERTGHPRAAAFYYRLVRDTYPLTDLSERSKAALMRLGDVAAPKVPAGIVSSRPATSPVRLDGAIAAASVPTSVPASVPTTGPEPATKNSIDFEPLDLEKMVSAAAGGPVSCPASMSATEPTDEASSQPATEPASEPSTGPASQPAAETKQDPVRGGPTNDGPMTDAQMKELLELLSGIGDFYIGDNITSQPVADKQASTSQPATEPAGQDTMQQDKASE